MTVDVDPDEDVELGVPGSDSSAESRSGEAGGVWTTMRPDPDEDVEVGVPLRDSPSDSVSLAEGGDV
jgi:hypothetical protein